jgi:hypothetical protein
MYLMQEQVRDPQTWPSEAPEDNCVLSFHVQKEELA